MWSEFEIWIRLHFLWFEFSGSDIALFEHYRVNWKTKTIITNSHGYLVTWNWLFNLKKFELCATKVRNLYGKSVWRNENKANFISCSAQSVSNPNPTIECWMLNTNIVAIRFVIEETVIMEFFNEFLIEHDAIECKLIGPWMSSMHSSLYSNLLMILSTIQSYYKTYQCETICLPKIRNVHSRFKWK